MVFADISIHHCVLGPRPSDLVNLNCSIAHSIGIAQAQLQQMTVDIFAIHIVINSVAHVRYPATIIRTNRSFILPLSPKVHYPHDSVFPAPVGHTF